MPGFNKRFGRAGFERCYGLGLNLRWQIDRIRMGARHEPCTAGDGGKESDGDDSYHAYPPPLEPVAVRASDGTLGNPRAADAAGHGLHPTSRTPRKRQKIFYAPRVAVSTRLPVAGGGGYSPRGGEAFIKVRPCQPKRVFSFRALTPISEKGARGSRLCGIVMRPDTWFQSPAGCRFQRKLRRPQARRSITKDEQNLVISRIFGESGGYFDLKQPLFQTFQPSAHTGVSCLKRYKSIGCMHDMHRWHGPCIYIINNNPPTGAAPGSGLRKKGGTRPGNAPPYDSSGFIRAI